MSAKCPHCGDEMELAHSNAYSNVLTYGGSALTLTKCCNNMIRHWRVQMVRFGKADMPPDGEDDWGYSASTKKEPSDAT